MLLSPSVWMRTKAIENDLRLSKGIVKTLHPNTIRGVALFRAYCDGAPTSSVLMGLMTLSLTLMEDLQQQGQPVPTQLLQANQALLELGTQIQAQLSHEQIQREMDGMMRGMGPLRRS